MIYSKFSIANPWSKDDFKNLWSWSGFVAKNKAWELEIISDKSNLLHIEFGLSFRGQDHAGLRLELGLVGFAVLFRVYDCRHWDYDKNQWAVYNDSNNKWN